MSEQTESNTAALEEETSSQQEEEAQGEMIENPDGTFTFVPSDAQPPKEEQDEEAKGEEPGAQEEEVEEQESGDDAEGEEEDSNLPPGLKDLEEEETEGDTDEDAEEEEDEGEIEVLDFQPFFDEYAETGEISEESYETLENTGLSREMVDAWKRGQEAVAELASIKQQAADAANLQALSEVVGGQDAYNDLLEEAQKSDPEGFKAFMKSTSLDGAKLALEALAARVGKTSGTEPKLVSGARGKAEGVKPFASLDESAEAMSNPKYDSDPAYRRLVDARLAITPEENFRQI